MRWCATSPTSSSTSTSNHRSSERWSTSSASLTLQRTSANNDAQKRVDERCAAWLHANDGSPEEFYDLRAMNGPTGGNFAKFYEELGRYIEAEMAPGAEERRATGQGGLEGQDVTFASKFISLPIVIREVSAALRATPGCELAPVPCLNTVARHNMTSTFLSLRIAAAAGMKILLGRLVAASSLTASDRNDIQDFMSLCRQAQLQHYIAAVKSTGAELGPDSSDSPAGQMRPADERAVIAATGMPSMEVTACIFACTQRLGCPRYVS